MNPFSFFPGNSDEDMEFRMQTSLFFLFTLCSFLSAGFIIRPREATDPRDLNHPTF